MFQWKNKETLPCAASDRMPYLFLLAAGIIEFLYITLESLFSYLGYYLAEDYLIVPCLLFLGYMLRSELSTFSKRRLLLAVAAVSWFVITQIIHRLTEMANHPMGTVFFVYLMAFPFAALAEDRNNTGIKIIGKLFLAACLVLVGYSVLLILDCVPEAFTPYLYWDGARLHPFWHPNNSASFFIIGIGFATAFLVQARKPVTKILLAAAIAAQFIAMALTNCRTALLLTCAFFGGTVFFLIWGGSWKRFLLGLLAAAVVLAGSWKLSGAIFQWNEDHRLAQLLADPETQIQVIVATEPQEENTQEQAAETEDNSAQDESTQEQVTETIVSETEDNSVQDESEQKQQPQILMTQDGETFINSQNLQGSLAQDMRTLNGRTYIWITTLGVLRLNKWIALFGTEYPGTVISAYYWCEVVHAHNAWLETWMRLGLPGLMLSLVFTALSVWSAAKLLLNPKTELWKKIIAMTTMCIMACGFLEPYLFITNVYYHVTDFIFFFLTGYLDYWSNRSREAHPSGE